MASGDRYTPEEIRMALALHAMSSGIEAHLRPELEAAGLGHIKPSTLRHWARDTRKDEYAQISQEVDAVMVRESIDKWRGIHTNAGAVATEAMRQAMEALRRGEIDVKDLTKTAKDAAVVAAVATDKVELLSGRPTDRVETDIGDITRSLAASGIRLVVAGVDVTKKPDAIDVQVKAADDEDEPPAALPVAV